MENTDQVEHPTLTKSYFTISQTGCTCCSNENRIFGPMATKDEALALADSNRRSKCWASQYSKEGRHSIGSMDTETLPDGRLIIGDRIYADYSTDELGHPDDYHYNAVVTISGS